MFRCAINAVRSWNLWVAEFEQLLNREAVVAFALALSIHSVNYFLHLQGTLVRGVEKRILENTVKQT